MDWCGKKKQKASSKTSHHYPCSHICAVKRLLVQAKTMQRIAKMVGQRQSELELSNSSLTCTFT